MNVNVLGETLKLFIEKVCSTFRTKKRWKSHWPDAGRSAVYEVIKLCEISSFSKMILDIFSIIT